MTGLTWTVLIPVKRLGTAKTRLRGAVPDSAHLSLVLALATDTVRAALTCPVVGRVIVVTSDPAATDRLAAVGATVVPDLPEAGLNQAIAYAATVARVGTPTGAMPGLAALTADLPALRPDELAAALRAAANFARPPAKSDQSARGAPSPPGPLRGYVPDAAGTGTVLLAAPPGMCLAPSFGAGSAAAHAASGAMTLEGLWPSLRRDVDTPADLAAAARLGLGPCTLAALTTVPR